MNIFKTSSFTWWQVGLLKLSVTAFGIVIGAYFSDFFSSYYEVLIGVGVVSGVYIGYVWLRQH